MGSTYLVYLFYLTSYYVDSFRDELIQRGISPRNIVHVLLNIDET